MNLSFEIEIGKAHAAVLSVLLILATASATVDVKDTLVMHGTLDLNGNKIVDLEGPDNPSDAATKQYVDNNAGDGAPELDWSEAQPVKDESSGTAKVSCEPGKMLRDVTCFDDARFGGSDAEGDNIRSCDTRTETSASESASDRPGVSGTCVPIKGVKRQVFSNQNSSNTFQVPPDTTVVEYRVYGGVGGGQGGSGGGGAGGYVKGSMPVNGETTFNVYVGQNGGNGRNVISNDPHSTTKYYEGDPEGSGGRGGCVPFDGVRCGGDGGDGYISYDYDGIENGGDGAGGGGAPSVIADSQDQIMVAAGGGGGNGNQYKNGGGGGGAGGGRGYEDADDTPVNTGGDSGNPGETFVDEGLPTPDSEGTSREGARVELAAIP